MTIAGIDEAGRGPLAGPVVAAAVVLDPQSPIDGLDDSKRLDATTRECLFAKIQTHALAVGVGMASVEEIDQLNILQATLLAMRRSYTAMSMEVDSVWVDGNVDPELPVETHTVVRGDRKILEIGAASIVAKVTRDRLMASFAKTYPDYGFEQHKGYPTQLHKHRLKLHGPCGIHRQSFSPVKEANLGR